MTGRRAGRLSPFVALSAVHAVAIVVLASRLPADAWFVGDPGVKLIAARSVVAHPSRPLEIDLPHPLDGAAAAFRQPFFAPHGDHAHAVTSALFPLLTAPFLAMFGLPGTFVVPALGWLLAVPLTAGLARALGTRAPPLAAAVAAAIASPLVFYGLELWEHAPAAACVAAAAVLAFGASTTAPGRRLFAAGLCAGIAALLRPEAGWWAVAILLALARSRSWPRPAHFAIGVAVALAPFVLYNVAHLGSPLGAHVGGNVGGGEGWLDSRLEFALTWVWPTRKMTQVLAVLLLCAHAAAAFVRRARAGHTPKALPTAMTWTGVALLVWLLAEMAQGHEVRENAWRVFPLALFAAIPGLEGSPARRLLWWLALAPAIVVLLTAPNDGGGQWGPRYLLPAVPFVVVLAVDSLTMLAAHARRLAIAVALLIVVGGLMVSRAAWVELSDSKKTYSALVRATAAEARGAAYLVTDVWWVPQMHAAAIDPGRMLYADAGSGAALLARLSGEDVVLVQTDDRATVRMDDWVRGTCYRPSAPVQYGVEGIRLTATRLSCR